MIIHVSESCMIAEHAERDAFFCFVHLMSDIRDHFCESLDHSESGIKGSLSQMMSILKSVDHELWENLVFGQGCMSHGVLTGQCCRNQSK